MSAAPSTTERGPKTTKRAPKTARQGLRGLAGWKAKENAVVDSAYENGIAAAAGFPALTALVEAWLPLARRAADFGAIHCDMDERRCGREETSVAEEHWRVAYRETVEAAASILRHVARDPNEIAAKIAVYNAISDDNPDMLNDDGGDNLIVASLLRDIAAQAASAPADRSAWEAARATLVAERQWMNENIDADTPASYHAAAATLLKTPAPDADALAYKLGVLSLDAALIIGRGAVFSEIDGQFPADVDDRLGDAHRAEDARAILSCYRDALRLAGRAAPSPHDAEQARLTYQWNQARDETYAARTAFLERTEQELADAESDEAESDKLFDLLNAAQERWEAMTPPTLAALGEVIAFSLCNSGPLIYSFQGADCPRSMRDLLDSGDPAEIIVGRAYMHILRMTGSDSPALLTPPICGLFPAFAAVEHDDVEAGWKRHHDKVEPYPSRISELATWQAPEAEILLASDGSLKAHWHYSRALFEHAQRLISEYEERGGKFTLNRQPDGSVFYGTVLAQDGSERAAEIEQQLATHAALRRTLFSIIAKREGMYLGEVADA